MRKYLFCLLTIIFACSCEQNDFKLDGNEIPKIQLTKEEYMSIAHDNPRSLTEEEVVEIARNFEAKYSMTKSRDISFSTNRKYLLGEDYATKIPSRSESMQVPMYEIIIDDGKEKKLAVVAADERIADVVAYMPYCIENKKSTEEGRKNNLMLEFVEMNLMGHLAFIDSVKFAMREKTIQKVSTELEIPIEKYSFAVIKDKIEVINTETKAYTGESGRINLDVDWGQESPYNLLLPSYPDPYFPDFVTRNYPLGCAVTALLMVYSYFEPSMKGYDNGQPMEIDWKYLKEKRKIVKSSYGPGGDPEDKIRMVSRLGLWIYNGTNTQSTKGSDGLYTSTTSNSELISDLDLYGIAHDPRTVIDPMRQSLLNRFYYDAKNYPITLMGGCREGSNSGHVWVIDGFTTDKMVHANMGWNGNGNGWYKISTDLCFDTPNGDYTTEFWTISKLRKK